MYVVLRKTRDSAFSQSGTRSDPCSSALQIQVSPLLEVLRLAPSCSLLWHPAASKLRSGVLVSQSRAQCSGISSLSWQVFEVIQNLLR